MTHLGPSRGDLAEKLGHSPYMLFYVGGGQTCSGARVFYPNCQVRSLTKKTLI